MKEYIRKRGWQSPAIVADENTPALSLLRLVGRQCGCTGCEVLGAELRVAYHCACVLEAVSRL